MLPAAGQPRAQRVSTRAAVPSASHPNTLWNLAVMLLPACPVPVCHIPALSSAATEYQFEERSLTTPRACSRLISFSK